MGDLVGRHNTVELDIFRRANVIPKGGKKLPWDKRVSLIRDHFPSIETLEWKAEFDKDFGLFAWIMNDILKVDAAEPSRSGPKPAVDVRTGAARLRQLMGNDYAELPFADAFSALAGKRSLNHLARVTGISRSQVRRLLRGDVEPSRADMEMIAAGFKKEPGYFLEYRMGLLLAIVAQKLIDSPEISVKPYRRLVGLAA